MNNLDLYIRYTENLGFYNPPQQESTYLLQHRKKNPEQFKQTKIDFYTWKHEYYVPWTTILDIFIILLYVLFCLTFQSTKMTFFLNFDTIFDTYFLGDADEDNDGLTYIYFKNEFIDTVVSKSAMLFEFEDTFPSQFEFQRSSNITCTLKEYGKPNKYYYYTIENLSLIGDLATYSSHIKTFEALIIDVDYLIIQSQSDSQSFKTLKYQMSFIDVDKLGIIEWKSKLIQTKTDYGDRKSYIGGFQNEVFPIAILIFDFISIVISTIRFFSFFKIAKKYAENNYISFTKAVMWKVDGWELFNLFYLILTFVSNAIYLFIVYNNFNNEKWLLFLLGVSAFVHSFGLFKSLRMKEELWMVARLTGRSLKESFILFIGFSPVYTGFVFIGVAWFGYFCNVFKGYLRTVKVLFSIAHSDIVMDTEELVKDAAVTDDWKIYVYIFAWTNLTVGIMINVVISIAEVAIDQLIHEKWTKDTKEKSFFSRDD